MELEIPSLYGPYGDDTKEELIDPENYGISPFECWTPKPNISQAFSTKWFKLAEGNAMKEHKVKEDSLAYILRTGLYSDVTFVVGKTEERFQAHKLILMTRSPYFDALFQRWETAKEPIIYLPEVETEDFQIFIHFLYTDEFLFVGRWITPISNELYMKLETSWHFGHFYQVPALIQAAGESMEYIMDYTNALKTYQIGVFFYCERIEKSAYRYIRLHANDVFSCDDEFVKLEVGTLCSILKHDDLVIDEIEIFKAVIRWAQYKCEETEIPATTSNLRNIAEKPLLLVRFPTMGPDEFKTQVVEQYEGLLTEAEIIQVLFLFVDQGKCLPKATESVSSLASSDDRKAVKDESFLPRKYSKLYFNTVPRRDPNKPEETEDENSDHDDEEDGNSEHDEEEDGTENDEDEGVYDETEDETATASEESTSDEESDNEW